MAAKKKVRALPPIPAGALPVVPEPSRPKLMPESTPDYMAGAWVSCLRWAIGKEEVRASFTQETGIAWSPPRNGFERAIDEATGADRKFVEAFVTWFNDAVWGDVNAEDGDDASP